MKRRIIALALSMTFIWCSVFNIAAAADVDIGATNEVENVDETEEDDDAKEESGTCGENLTWVLDEEGTLTISGTGEMNSWSGDSSDESGNGRVPWDDENVHRIVIEEGVTSIGDYAFFMCTECTEVQLADSITKIGNWAFAYCGGVSEIKLPEQLASIGELAFRSCNSLIDLVIPEGTISIGAKAFYMCENLESISIADSVKFLGEDTFIFCGELRKVKWSAGLETIESESFYDSNKLTEIEIPEGVTTLEEDALINTGLKSITIPKSVTYMGDYSVGYTIEDDEDGNTVKLPVEGFKIYGYSGSAAETYADSTEFEFVPLDGAEDELIIVPEKTDSTYVQGSGKDLVIYCTGEFSKFVSAEMDGQLIDPSNYTVEEGSTVLTLASTYLDTLSVGKHVVTLNYVDGSISCDIMILRADQANSEKNEGTLQTNGTEQGNQNKVVGNSVKTGDSSHAMIWLMLIMASMLVSVITCAQVKKK